MSNKFKRMIISDKHKGVIAVIISAVVFGSMPLMAKIIYREGGNPITLTLLRFLLILPFLYILIKKNDNLTLKLTKEELKKLTIIGVMGYATTPLLLYSSYNHIPSGMATTIHFVYPVLVILGCILFYKEKTSHIKRVSVLLCLLGVILFFDGNGDINIIGIILSFASSITYAFYTIYFEKSGLKNMSVLKSTFYLCIIAAIFTFIFGMVTKSLTINIKPLGWIMSIALSLIVGLGGASLFQIGVKIIGSQNTAILSTFEPITSVIIGVLILNEGFGIKTVLGVLLIVIAVVLISVFEK